MCEPTTIAAIVTAGAAAYSATNEPEAPEVRPQPRAPTSAESQRSRTRLRERLRRQSAARTGLNQLRLTGPSGVGGSGGSTVGGGGGAAGTGA